MASLRLNGQPSANARGTRVLVTGGDHTGALAAVRALRAARYEPWVAASSRKGYAARSCAASGVVVVPDARRDPRGFTESLSKAATEYGLTALLGGTEHDLIAIARGRDRLGALASGMPGLDAVLRITSKRTVNRLALDLGLRVPDTIELDGAHHQQRDLRMPVIVKPDRSVVESSDGELVHRNARRVDSNEDLAALSKDLSDGRWLIQTYLPGRLGAICGVAWRGEIVNAVHQMAERIWPVDAGVSAYAKTVAADPFLQDGVARLVGTLAWSGIFQAQFIHAEAGPHLIDFNPRIYGSLALATAAGVNLPAIWVALLKGSPVQPTQYRVGVRYRSEELDARALLHVLSTSGPAAATRGLMPRRNTAHSVLSITDPLPLLTSLAKLRQLHSD